MTKNLTIGKMELLLAEVSGVGAIVDGKGHVRAVFSKRAGWITREDEPAKWDNALDLVSVRVMRGAPEPEKPARKAVQRKPRRSRKLEALAEQNE